MDIKAFLIEWLAHSNAFDIEKYLEGFHQDAELNDPSVGRIFKGHSGIRKYFEDYFIGYKTQTRLVRLKLTGPDTAHLEVTFTGEFPEGEIGGIFDFLLKDNKILLLKADLT